jgi:hypothetical protein
LLVIDRLRDYGHGQIALAFWEGQVFDISDLSLQVLNIPFPKLAHQPREFLACHSRHSYRQ